MNFIFDILSVTFACFAWYIPISAMRLKNAHKSYHYLVLSLAACAFSLQFQVFKVMMDMTGANSIDDDTFHLITTACALVMLGTFVLCPLSIYIKKNRHK